MSFTYSKPSEIWVYNIDLSNVNKFFGVIFETNNPNISMIIKNFNSSKDIQSLDFDKKVYISGNYS